MTKLTFYDNFVREPKDAEYTITVSQSLTAETAGTGGSPNAGVTDPPDAKQRVILRGPRFSLDPSLVQRTFPADGSTGVFDDVLPMIVLTRASLPWERDVKPAGTPPDSSPYPWMALLVLDADELLTPGGGDPPPPGSQASPTRTAAVPLDQAVNGTFNGERTTGLPSGTFAPTLTLEDDEDPAQIRCNVIDLSSATFTALAPGPDDSRFLAHVRVVSTDDKETAAGGADAWYSTVIANRFALPPDGAHPDRRHNVVHLVSLEGLDGHLTEDGGSVPAGFDRVRLISLWSWAFTCLPDPAENFSALALGLLSSGSDAGSGLLLRVPAPDWAVSPEPATPPTPATIALDRIERGYTALGYTAQSGEQTFAWYRGPLAPQPTTRFLQNASPDQPDNPKAPLSASEAMVYDPTTGLFDQSYAVAFQTGRSLALASLPFLTALLQYRRTTHALVDQLFELMRAPGVADQLVKDGILDANGNLTGTGVVDLAALLMAGVTPRAMVDVLATRLSNGIAEQIGTIGGYSVADATGAKPTDPATPSPTVADLSALMQDPTVVGLLQQVSGIQSGAPGSGTFTDAILPDTIVEWLAQTALLHGLPFTNLVPDARMLTPESIRFFYIDPNWIDALIDGALSAGIQSSRDSLLHQLLRDPLRDAVDAAMLQVRDRARGVTPSPTGPQGTPAGFVLRSALVSGWPGLQVRAWSAADATNPMKPLRLDRVSADVMLCIYPDVPVRVELDEPSEGLVFGLEETSGPAGQSKGVRLRYLPGTPGAATAGIGTVVGGDGNPTWLMQDALPTRTGPLDGAPLRIAGSGGLSTALQALLPGGQPDLGPAAFAVEMVKVPERMLFEPTKGSH